MALQLLPSFTFLALSLIAATSTSSFANANTDFKTYYTKLAKGESWEATSRTWLHPDIVVQVNSQLKIEFWRGTSYLPVLVSEKGRYPFPEIVPRKGDGSKTMPDKVNMYSHVKVIESGTNKAIVQWRYMPTFSAGNPKTDESHTKFVDEIFTFNSDGSVSRSVRQGSAKYDDWADPLNKTVQIYKLTQNGITTLSTTSPNSSSTSPSAIPSEVKTPIATSPRFWLKLDEGSGSAAQDAISGSNLTITGDKANWKRGVSGTALALNGYTNYLSDPATNLQAISQAVTMETWIAIGAYPWYQQAILHKGDVDTLESFGLYIDEGGELFMRIRNGTSVEELVYPTKLSTRKWYHIAATYEASSGSIALYLNGVLATSNTVSANPIKTGSAPLRIGHGLSDSGYNYTLDALIDEVRIYDVALSSSQISESYNKYKPEQKGINNPDIEKRTIPEGSTQGRFGARYEKLNFYDTWEQLMRDSEYADIVIEYDDAPLKTIFWRAATYSPIHLNDNKGRFNSEFNENFRYINGKQYCCAEPMSDKQHHYGHARIIENSPARVVVHWRYAQVFDDHMNNNYDSSTGWGDWSDWYMYAYPDGVTAYEMIFWSSSLNNYVEWGESMLLLAPNEVPEDIIPFNNTVENINQSSTTAWNWSKDWNTLDKLHNTGTKPQIQRINIKGSEYKPFTMVDDSTLEFWGPYNDFNRYSHWPVGQKKTHGESDYGKSSRVAHTSILKTAPPNRGYVNGRIASGTWRKNNRLEGMSNKNTNELRKLYRSWSQPPAMYNTSGISGRYSKDERAFKLTSSAEVMSFDVAASSANPLINPCFVIQNWGTKNEAIIKLDSSPVTGAKQGIVYGTNGNPSMVIYLPITSETNTNISIQKGTAPISDKPYPENETPVTSIGSGGGLFFSLGALVGLAMYRTVSNRISNPAR
ncbi:LamG domain-containing protein [Vibrio sp. HN007]|uniref:LamG domain-containing protein n=1 Tax=Vibrio iocasae TaxID=3098914 RepID=UPI0035D4F640